MPPLTAIAPSAPLWYASRRSDTDANAHRQAHMITFNCTIQEGIIPDDLRPALASELARISTGILGGDPTEVSVQWIEVPRGFGFRGGELSTTSAVRGEIPPGCEQETRVRLMQTIQDRWMELTGCTTAELVVSARDRRDT